LVFSWFFLAFRCISLAILLHFRQYCDIAAALSGMISQYLFRTGGIPGTENGMGHSDRTFQNAGVSLI